MKLRFFVIFISLILYTGCITIYSAPICTSQNFADVPNFEGSYIFRMQNPFDLEFIEIEGTVVRLDTGIYEFNSEKYATCEIDGTFFLEQKKYDPEKEKKKILGYQAAILLRNSNGSFDQVFAATDQKILKEKNIPYKVLEVETEKFNRYLKMYSNQDSKSKLLLIDNSKISPEDFSQILDPLSIKLSLMPSATKKAKTN